MNPPTMNEELRAAAQAVVDRWDTPLWKDVPHTAEYIGRLRAALATPPASAPAKGRVTEEMVSVAVAGFNAAQGSAHHAHLIGNRFEWEQMRAALVAAIGEGEGLPRFLLEMGEQIRTQDNRCTAHAMFCVQRHVVIDGLDASLVDRHMWVRDGERVSRDHWPTLDAAWDKSEDFADLDDEQISMDEFERYGYKEEWETVMVCFTEQGAKDYLSANGHNLRGGGWDEPRIFVESFRRCQEMLSLREWLTTLPPPPSEPKAKGDKS